jgi:hypothetical protein
MVAGLAAQLEPSEATWRFSVHVHDWSLGGEELALPKREMLCKRCERAGSGEVELECSLEVSGKNSDVFFFPSFFFVFSGAEKYKVKAGRRGPPGTTQEFFIGQE